MMRFWLCWLLLVVPTLGSERVATPLERGRGALRLMLFDEAAMYFRAAREQARLPVAEADVGLALALLGRSPRTEERMREAEALLENVVRRPEVPPALRAFAAYQAARVGTRWAHVKVQPGELHPLQRVADEFGGEFFGQQALVKLTLLESYAPGTPAEQRERLRGFESRISRISDPIARRDFHTTLGHASLYLEADPDLAYRHLEQAHGLGTGASFRQRSFLIRLGELAFNLDRPADARSWYQAYLKAFPGDGRRRWIEDRLLLIDGETPPRE